jgi:hypothetical protein
MIKIANTNWSEAALYIYNIYIYEIMWNYIRVVGYNKLSTFYIKIIKIMHCFFLVWVTGSVYAIC